MTDSSFGEHDIFDAAYGLEDLQIITRGWSVAVRPDTPPDLKTNLIAAVLGHQLGLMSVDYVRRRYAKALASHNQTFTPRYEIAYDATASAKVDLSRFNGRQRSPDYDSGTEVFDGEGAA